MFLNSYKFDPAAEFPHRDNPHTTLEHALRKAGVDLSRPAFGITLTPAQVESVQETLSDVRLKTESAARPILSYVDLADAGHEGVAILSWLCCQPDGILSKHQLLQFVEENRVESALDLLVTAGAVTIENEAGEIVRITSFGAKYISMLDDTSNEIE